MFIDELYYIELEGIHLVTEYNNKKKLAKRESHSRGDDFFQREI